MEKTNISMEKRAHLFKKIEATKFLPSGSQEKGEEMIYAEDEKKRLNEAKQELWRVWLDGCDQDKMAALLMKFFGEAENLCGQLSPQYKLPCTLPSGHKGNHAHYPWVWAGVSGIILPGPASSDVSYLTIEPWKNKNPCKTVREGTYLHGNFAGDLPGANPPGKCHFDHSKNCDSNCSEWEGRPKK